MSSSDLGRDVEPQTKPVTGFQIVATVEGLEEPLELGSRNLLTAIGNRQLEIAFHRFCGDANGLALRAMRQGITKEIGEKLADANTIAVDRLAQRIMRLDNLLRRI